MPPSTSPGPILVVDDDAVHRSAVSQALAELKLDVVEASSADEALARIAASSPSLVLLDVSRRRFDACALLRKLRELPATSEVPVIVLAADDAGDELAKALELGADDFARRPFHSTELVMRVRRQLLLGEQTQRVTVDRFEAERRMRTASLLREEGAVLASFRDVTKQRAVDVGLVETKDFVERVIDSSFDAIVSADMRGRVVLFNRAAERICGRAAAEVVGTDVRLLYPAGGAEEIMKRLQSGGGRIDELRVDIVDSTGTAIPVSFTGALIMEGDTPVGSVGIFTDLREKVRMEHKLQHAQQQLLSQERQAVVVELAGAAAHELNQPLTSVRNYATLLRKELTPGTRAASAAEIIESEAERMAEIVRKIGKITKYETKSYVGTQKILDLDRASGEEEPE